jgi:hypothetical protein
MKYIKSGTIKTDATASEMRSAMKNYYWKYFRSDITVNLTMYDSNGTNTTNKTAATKHVYYIVMRKLISSVSTG